MRAMPVPERHPLRYLFDLLTEKSFYEQLGWPDRHVIRYISDLLIEFTDIEKMYRLKSEAGRDLREVAQMLQEAELSALNARTEQEREVHRYIGDYTLFMMGIFPEYLRRLRTVRWIQHTDALIDYAKVGKRAYRIVSELITDEAFRQVSPLFKKLSEHFELCVMGLGFVRQDLDRLQQDTHRRIKEILLN